MMRPAPHGTPGPNGAAQPRKRGCRRRRSLTRRPPSQGKGRRGRTRRGVVGCRGCLSGWWPSGRGGEPTPGAHGPSCSCRQRGGLSCRYVRTPDPDTAPEATPESCRTLTKHLLNCRCASVSPAPASVPKRSNNPCRSWAPDRVAQRVVTGAPPGREARGCVRERRRDLCLAESATRRQGLDVRDWAIAADDEYRKAG